MYNDVTIPLWAMMDEELTSTEKLIIGIINTHPRLKLDQYADFGITHSTARSLMAHLHHRGIVVSTWIRPRIRGQVGVERRIVAPKE